MKDNQMEFFNQSHQAPLAYRLRPASIEDFFGQAQIRKKIENLDADNLPHIVFNGPPGCGKTTLANLLAKMFGKQLLAFNAVLGGVKELRVLIEEAKNNLLAGNRTIIFIDEIHRFNKAQQDALLPYLESGEFILFGATTENPNTSLNPAIISRVQRWRLSELSTNELRDIIKSACKKIDLDLNDETIEFLAANNNGDARAALNQIERLEQNKDKDLNDLNFLKEYLVESYRVYDDARHYDVISAFIKSVRGSDVNASLLWLAVMLEEGEDIEFIARRLIILASEDIGNADPRGLQMATSAHYAIKQIGMPEARIILSQVTTYLALAPKSNASYLAIDEALAYVRNNPMVPVPTHLRNHHPDKKNYRYPHAHANHWIEQKYMPEELKFYQSSDLAYEKMQTDFQSKIRH
ncbi:MAG: replication-associated recombination protein A [Bdellovibrionota bacterium]|nr:replication-associated recombination protein A [Bdellovibrionota bacterium]